MVVETCHIPPLPLTNTVSNNPDLHTADHLGYTPKRLGQAGKSSDQKCEPRILRLEVQFLINVCIWIIRKI
jgi:hypothetical protein